MVKDFNNNCLIYSAKIIRKSIYSLNNQSFRNIEHILVDGNSSDETLSIAKEGLNI